MAYRFDVATANIYNGLSESQANSDVDTVFGIADVVGWQEILIGSYAETRIRNRSDWGTVGLDRYYQPISWKSSVWELVNWGDQLCDDTYRARHMTWAVLKRKATGEHLRVINTHLISNAEWHLPASSSNSGQRAAWTNHWNVMNDKIDTWMADGSYYPIIGTGDFNRRVEDSMPKFASNQEFIQPTGIDHIYAIPAGKFTPVQSVRNLDGATYYTDHGPRIWRIDFA